MQAKVHNELETSLVELHQLLIDFQIKNIIRFSKGWWYQGTHGECDWQALCNKIQCLETSFWQDFLTIAIHGTKIDLQRSPVTADKT